MPCHRSIRIHGLVIGVVDGDATLREVACSFQFGRHLVIAGQKLPLAKAFLSEEEERLVLPVVQVRNNDWPTDGAGIAIEGRVGARDTFSIEEEVVRVEIRLASYAVE